MSVLIVACGDTGVTLKAGNILAEMIGDAVVVDGKAKFDLSADTYVLGTNVHFGKFNKRFLKLAKRLSENNSKIYVYISGAEVERSRHYINLARDVIPNAEDIRYVWGELDPRGVSFFKRFAIDSFIDGRRKDGLPKPRLLDKELRALSQSVRENL